MTREERDKLILEHEGYVTHIAIELKRKLPQRVTLEELQAAGKLGLVEAADNFDASRGREFTTFATYRIRGAMLDNVRKSTWLPPALRRKLDGESGANDVLEDAATAVGRDTLDAEAKRFREAVARLGAVYLLAHRGDDGTDAPADPAIDDDPSSGLARRELASRVTKALARLGQPHRRIMEQMYFEHKTMTQIAEREGCDKSTIHRWHRSAVQDLRRWLEEEPPSGGSRGQGLGRG